MALVSIGPGCGHVEAILAETARPSRVLLVDTEEGGRSHGWQDYGAAYCDLGKPPTACGPRRRGAL